MEVKLFCITLECTIVLALNLYVLELNLTINMEAVIAFLLMFNVFSFSFSHFYLSERLTDDLVSIGDIFYNSPWYRLLPAKQQKLLVLPIQQAQREFRLKGLGIFICSLAAFSTVTMIGICAI